MFSNDGWDPGSMMDGYGGAGMGHGGAWMMVLVGLLLLLLVGATLVLSLRASGTRVSPGARRDDPVSGSARDVLDLRLARGEVSAEDYAATRTLLER